MVVEPRPAVGAGGVVLPLATVDMVRPHRAIDGAINGLLLQGHHRPVPEGQNFLYAVCGGWGNSVSKHCSGFELR